ncbi:heterokaryon incompatibility protein-domain-containing protein [Xylaria bambusicola]|uniref:heterokaryon incompatibility protein-domain-containing protein n=1 Tax=Xylaria bambusicola TaxID=326684 RepID=UPI00200828CC|nr:heterokaryon incompatibility protein-domain-containing protein [Xylaria bambusicola]KAI0518245.1 heterokaryon incompatibility protein-domain-containing protein [Xylaria bambusicola]
MLHLVTVVYPRHTPYSTFILIPTMYTNVKFASNPYRTTPIDTAALFERQYAAYYSGIKYRPLSSQYNEIRLLRIQPAESLSDRIVCQLEHTPLNHPRDSVSGYVALSYRWGDIDSGTHVILAGYHIRITMNLYHALLELRKRQHYLVWADGLCINQSDYEERSQHIPRMAAIYRTASLVISYLDSQDPMDQWRSVKVLEINVLARQKRKEMDEYLKKKRRTPKKAPKPRKGFFSFQRSAATENPQRTDIEKPSKLQISQPQHAALVKLLEHEYWMRAWIIQEISVNPKLKVIWGSYEIDLDGLTLTLQELTHVDEIKNSQARHHIEQLSQIRKSQLALQPLALVDALTMCYRARASVRRDRVFALLGLTHDGPSLLPVASYEVPTNKMCRDMTVRMIQATGNLEMVVAKNYEVSNWYPNWFASESFAPPSVTKDSGGILSLIQHPINRYYRASRNLKADFVPSLVDTDIRLKGLRIGQVSACSPTLREAKASDLDRSQITKHRTRREKLSREDPLYAKYASASEALRWLLVEIAGEQGSDGSSSQQGTLKDLGRLLHRRETSVEQFAPNLIQWMNCCEKQHFKINGEPLVSYFSERNETGRSTPAKFPNTCRIIQKTLEAGLRLGSLDDGKLGWFHKNTAVGDKVAILLGSAVPCVIRPSPGNSNSFTIVGPCIIFGVMNGEALENAMDRLEYFNVV